VAINRFLHALRRPTRLLVAISGGSDSTGLLVALAEAIRTRHLPHTLVSATIDHGLRSASADEARQVAALCQALDIPHRIMRWTDEKPATGLSEAARLARYRLLSEAAASMNADALVTGHTLDDQVETVAMRLSRSGERLIGAGRHGICNALCRSSLDPAPLPSDTPSGHPPATDRAEIHLDR
jgi:tRNA(Ile)-lysidine synthase